MQGHLNRDEYEVLYLKKEERNVIVTILGRIDGLHDYLGLNPTQIRTCKKLLSLLQNAQDLL